MSTMPVLAEVPGQQELYTRDHGTVKVAGLSFIDGGFHIVKCPNGAYMHSNGLPVSDEDQLRSAIPQPFLADALKWWENRHELEENPPQPIIFHREGYPIFADGSIPEFQDLYNYFSPGAILTAAIVELQKYHDRQGKPKAEVEAQPRSKLESVKTEPAPAPKKAAPAKKSHKKKSAAKPKTAPVISDVNGAEAPVNA